MKPLLPLFVALCVAACMPTPEPVPIPTPRPNPVLKEQEPDSCGAGKLGHLVGKTEGMLRTVHLKGRYRAIRPGGMVTQDYDSLRLNVYLDDKGLIEQLSCG